jgi:hypothetical protein
VGLLLAGALFGLGCRTTAKDVERWGSTENGPTKLSAVMQHAKYDVNLRTRAALTLISMRPRDGRRVGIDRLIDTLQALPPRLRSDVLPKLTDALVEKLEAPPPAEGAPDESIPYKDVAHDLLTYEGKGFIEDPAQRARLEQALTRWAMQDFVGRIDAPGQRVGMSQLLEDLGPKSVTELPALLKPDAPKSGDIVRIVAKVGDEATKRQAAVNLTEVARYAASAGWREARSKEMQSGNPEAFQKASSEAIQKHLMQLQEDEVLRLFAAMKRLGQQPVYDFLVAFARDAEYPEKQRVGALAALEGQVSAAGPAVLDGLWSLATDERTPDALRATAFVRAGEASREVLLERLERAILEGKENVRLAAAEVLLGKTDAGQVTSFLDLIGRVDHLSVGEPLRYGRLLGSIEKFDPHALDSYIKKRSAPVAARLTALGYYYAYGTNDQRSMLEGISDETQKVPECAEGESDCSWLCGDERIETIGDFYRYCVEPHMSSRTASGPQQPSDPSDKKASDVSPKASQGSDKGE